LALCIAPTKPYVSTESLEKLNHTKNLQLEQKTPIRVLHRRPNTVRPRSVYEMSAEPVPKEMLSHFDDLELDLDSNESSHQVLMGTVRYSGHPKNRTNLVLEWPI
jgi:hypothetical protein